MLRHLLLFAMPRIIRGELTDITQELQSCALLQPSRIPWSVSHGTGHLCKGARIGPSVYFFWEVIHVFRVLSAICVTQNQQERFPQCTELHVWLCCSSSSFLSHFGMAEGGLQTPINFCCCNVFKGTVDTTEYYLKVT